MSTKTGNKKKELRDEDESSTKSGTSKSGTSKSGNKKKEQRTEDDGSAHETLNIENVFSELETKTLKDIAIFKNISVRISSKVLRKGKDEVRNEYLKTLTSCCREAGIIEVIRGLPKKLLVDLTKHLEESYLTTNGKNSLTQVVLSKRCYEKILQSNVLEFFDQVEKKDLIEFLEYYNKKVSGRIKNDKTKLLEIVAEEFEYVSLFMFLETLKPDILQDMCKEMYITADTTSSRILANCIIKGEHHIQDDNSDENIDINLSNKKPKNINKNCSKADLRHYFNAIEIREFLKKNKMITSGKKTALINRVIDYFEDPEAAILKFNPAKRKETRDSKKNKKNKNKEEKSQKDDEYSVEDMDIENKKKSNKDDESKSEDKSKNDSYSDDGKELQSGKDSGSINKGKTIPDNNLTQDTGKNSNEDSYEDDENEKSSKDKKTNEQEQGNKDKQANNKATGNSKNKKNDDEEPKESSIKKSGDTGKNSKTYQSKTGQKTTKRRTNGSDSSDHEDSNTEKNESRTRKTSSSRNKQSSALDSLAKNVDKLKIVDGDEDSYSKSGSY